MVGGGRVLDVVVGGLYEVWEFNVHTIGLKAIQME